MANILYVSGNPMDLLKSPTINKLDHNKWVTGFWNIWAHIRNISHTVKEIIGIGLHIVPDLDDVETLRWKGETSTRSLLKDTHNTFGLLMYWLSIASEHLKKWKKVWVELYKEDIHHREFIEGIEGATDNGTYAKWLTLEISKDPYWSIDTDSIAKLQQVSALWVWIGIEDFHEKENWEIDIDSITSIIKWRIKPRYIKISKTVIDKIKNNMVMPRVSMLYEWLVKMWISIIEGPWRIAKKQETNEVNKQKIMADRLIDSADIEYEPMLTLQWEVWVEELLVRFDKWLRTDIWLDQLKELWYTEGLAIKMLWVAIERAKEGKRVSLNLYIKDIWSVDLIERIRKMIQNLSVEHRKNIVFEILEEKYGIINKQFIEHVRMLQAMGLSIAIDDLYVSEKNNGMSLEILNELLEVGIYPDYIKLDGKHCMAIQDDTITDTELGKIITLIWQFALRKSTTVVAEWVQDIEHAKKIKHIFLGIHGINIIFQGRQINTWNFGEKNEAILMS